ncbi:MAG: neutral zinc metallopeptidase [Mastigocoleus sp.]
MKPFKALTAAVIGISCVLASVPVQAREWRPRQVVDGVYQGIQSIHGYKRTPKLLWNLRPGFRGGCGPVRSSHYCKRNHTVYIPRRDVAMAYQHGDAALAYIIAHEYAHAMQTAYGFTPRSGVITELQADCLAGVYLGLIPNIEFDNRDIKEIATLAYRIGDYAWGSKHHHGTPKQRVVAVVRGIQGSVNGKGISTCRAK